MKSFEEFEDINAWQAARELTNRIYGSTREGSFSRDEGLKKQIRRAAVSIMSNIAEGFERDSDRAFAQFLSTAKASAAEVRSQLYVARDQEYISDDTFRDYRELTDKISRMLNSLINYLDESDEGE